MSKPWDRLRFIPIEEAEPLLRTIEEQLRNRFNELRDQKYNTNTKGYDYEKILKQFFEDYLGGSFDFSIRVGILDSELKALSVLKPAENEFDVVALYKNAVPRLVINRMVPYDSVAFLIEVKQTLTTQTLADDLQKLGKLNELQVNDQRIKGPSFPHAMNRPIRMLFYYEAKADLGVIFKELRGKYGDSWDILVILNKDIVCINSTIPFVKQRFKAPFSQSPHYPLVKAMFFTCSFIRGDYVNAWIIFWNLIRSTLGPPEK